MKRSLIFVLFLFIGQFANAVEGDTLYARLFPKMRWQNVEAGTVKHLRIDTLDKAVIPQLGKLRQIESLSLSGHQIEQLPEVLCSLSTLRQLDLSHNRLSTLPQNFAQLQQLEELWLGYNPQLNMGQVIDVLALLPKLKALHIEADSLKEIPPSIARLSQLQFLDLSGNRFSQLPPEFGQLTQLNTLWLNNEADAFDLEKNIPVLSPLANLRELHIEGDHLQRLPSQLLLLPSLERVYAGENPMLRLPSNRDLRHSHLRLLDVHNAPLPPAEIQRVQQTAPGLRIRF
ncbi:MAG: leucine-rich repeat domain-containing protein [Bacteroidia bacterium]